MRPYIGKKARGLDRPLVMLELHLILAASEKLGQQCFEQLCVDVHVLKRLDGHFRSCVGGVFRSLHDTEFYGSGWCKVSSSLRRRRAHSLMFATLERSIQKCVQALGQLDMGSGILSYSGGLLQQ